MSLPNNIYLLARIAVFSSIAAFFGLVLLMILAQFNPLNTASHFFTRLFASDTSVIYSTFFFYFLKLLVVSLFTSFLYLISREKISEKMRNYYLPLLIALAFALYAPVMIVYFSSLEEMLRQSKFFIYFLNTLMYSFIPICVSSFLSTFFIKRLEPNI